MKKYYHLLTKGVLRGTLFWLILFFVGLLAGSLYSISLKNQTELFFVLNQMTMTPIHYKGNQWIILKESIGIHMIQLVGMWIGGLSKATFVISLILFIVIGFSYGFVITSFYLLYGVFGFVINVLLFGLQGLLVVFAGMYIGEHSLRYQQRGKEIYLKTYISALGYAFISIFIIAGIDAYIQPVLQNIIHIIG